MFCYALSGSWVVHSDNKIIIRGCFFFSLLSDKLWPDVPANCPRIRSCGHGPGTSCEVDQEIFKLFRSQVSAQMNC